MKKSHQIVLNSIFPLSANIAWFYAACYQRRMSGNCSVSDLIFDALLSVMMAVCLLIIFARNTTLYTPGAFKLKGQSDAVALAVKLAVLLILRGLLDASLSLVPDALADWSYFAVDWLIVLYWILVYIVAVRKDLAIWRKPKCLIAFGVAMIVILGVSFAYDMGLTQQYELLTDKYTEASPYLARASANLDYLNSVNAFAVDTVIVFALILIHSIGTIERQKLASDSEYAKSIRTIKRDQSVFRTFIRCDFIIAVVCIWAVLHMALAPESVLSLRINHPTDSLTNYEATGEFNERNIENSVYMGLGTLTEENACYYTQELILQKGDLSPEEFVLNGSEPDFILTDTGKQYSQYVKYTIDGNQVYVYGYYAIGYYENGAPKLVRMEELNDTASSPILTALCKDLLADGNLFIFEYGYEYLLRNDADFIKPYIDRYASGAFTEAELEWLNGACCRSAYMMDVAKAVASE